MQDFLCLSHLTVPIFKVLSWKSHIGSPIYLVKFTLGISSSFCGHFHQKWSLASFRECGFFKSCDTEVSCFCDVLAFEAAVCVCGVHLFTSVTDSCP